jgi:predicted DCC family thiol-disulfide oxidoreductase YuxK
MSPLPAQLVLYDGECGFCSKSVQWVLDRDSEQKFSFAPLQGETAEALRSRHAKIPDSLDTMVLVQSEKGMQRVYLRSAAVFRVAAELPGIWRVLGLLRVLPSGLMDLFYRPVAAIRHQLVGGGEQCRLVLPEEAHRFLP